MIPPRKTVRTSRGRTVVCSFSCDVRVLRTLRRRYAAGPKPAGGVSMTCRSGISYKVPLREVSTCLPRVTQVEWDRHCSRADIYTRIFCHAYWGRSFLKKREELPKKRTWQRKKRRKNLLQANKKLCHHTHLALTPDVADCSFAGFFVAEDLSLIHISEPTRPY